MENSTTGDQLRDGKLTQRRERRLKWYLSNRDAVMAKCHEYYTQNKEAIQLIASTPHDCTLCGGRFTTAHKWQHLQTHKHTLALKHKLEQEQTTADLPTTEN